jgi:hypothetical protein
MLGKRRIVRAMSIVIGSIAAIFLLGCFSAFGYTLFAE